MAEKHIPITGGCLCGAVRYESSEPPVNGGYCHCRMCQKTSGSLLVVIYDEDPAPVILIGSLDHPDDWPLTQDGWWGHAYVDEKVSWHVISDDMPQCELNYPEIPEGQGGTS